jgi:hypothetical protein
VTHHAVKREPPVTSHPNHWPPVPLRQQRSATSQEDEVVVRNGMPVLAPRSHGQKHLRSPNCPALGEERPCFMKL